MAARHVGETPPDGFARAALLERCAGAAPLRLPHAADAMMTRRTGAHGRFFVSDAHKLAYLDIPRCASTTLRGVMKDLGGAYRRLQQQQEAAPRHGRSDAGQRAGSSRGGPGGGAMGARVGGAGPSSLVHSSLLFNNSAALRPDELSEAQRSYYTFTFVCEPIHHLVDGWTFVRTGGPDAPFNASDPAWAEYRRDPAPHTVQIYTVAPLGHLLSVHCAADSVHRAWHRHDLGAAHRRSADWLRTHLFSNPHLLPQAPAPL